MEVEALAPVFASSPALDEMFSKETTTVQDVLSEPMSFRLFRQSDRRIVQFFVKNIGSLVDLVFSDGDMVVAAKAFAILEFGDQEVTTAMLQDRTFPCAAMTLVSGKEENPLKLNRLASLTYAVAMVDQTFVATYCGFVLQLLMFSREPAILALFEYICSENKNNRDIHGWLIELGFVQILEREIEQCGEPKDDQMDEEATKLCSLFTIVGVCARNSAFVKANSWRGVVAILNQNVGAFPSFVEDGRWTTLAVLYCERTMEIMRGLFQAAIELVKDKKKSRTRSGVAAITILAEMLRADDVMRPFFVPAEVPATCLSIMLNNPDHTILHCACRKLMVLMFAHTATRDTVVEICLPALIEATEHDNVNMTASAVETVKQIVKATASDSLFLRHLMNAPGWERLLRGKIAEQDAMLRSPYGESNEREAFSFGDF